MHQSNKLDFTGQSFYLGIDVHKPHWLVTIRNNNMELKTLSMNPSSQELNRYMRKHYPGGTYYSCYEAGFCGFWIHRELQQLGFKNIVLHAADIPTSDKEKVTKTDPVDSRKMARELEKKSLKGIYIPDEYHQQLRSLSRLRKRTVESQSRVKNRIKGHLYTYGIVIPSNQEMLHWSGYFINWLSSLKFSHGAGKDYVLFCTEELKQHRVRIAKIMRSLKHHIKQNGMWHQIELLRSIPGFGFVIAISFFAEIMDINRFSNFDKLAAYVGLIPSIHGSGDKIIENGIIKRRNGYLRHLIVEAAWVAIRKEPALLAAFNRLARRMKKQDAIIRIAKKLLRRIFYVLKNQKPYVIAVVE